LACTENAAFLSQIWVNFVGSFSIHTLIICFKQGTHWLWKATCLVSYLQQKLHWQQKRGDTTTVTRAWHRCKKHSSTSLAISRVNTLELLSSPTVFLYMKNVYTRHFCSTLSQNNGWLGNLAPNAMHGHRQYFKIWKKCKSVKMRKDSITQQLPCATAAFGTSSTCNDFRCKMYQENELFPLQKHSLLDFHYVVYAKSYVALQK
jgi:hypothetical protein